MRGGVVALLLLGHALCGVEMIVAVLYKAAAARVPVGSDIFVEHDTREAVGEVGLDCLAKLVSHVPDKHAATLIATKGEVRRERIGCLDYHERHVNGPGNSRRCDENPHFVDKCPADLVALASPLTVLGLPFSRGVKPRSDIGSCQKFCVSNL